jgi:hypothetical protein
MGCGADIFFVLFGVMVVSDQFAERAHDWAVTAAVVFVVLSVAIYVVSAVAYVMLGVATTGAWLDGTTLSMRVALRTTSVDLATADIHCGLQGNTLIARDPRSGSTLTLTLRGPGSVRLPSAQLRAVAEAISQGQARTTSQDARWWWQTGCAILRTADSRRRWWVQGRPGLAEAAGGIAASSWGGGSPAGPSERVVVGLRGDAAGAA